MASSTQSSNKSYWINPKATPEGLWGGAGATVPAGMKAVSQQEQQSYFAQQRATGIAQEKARSTAVNYVPGKFAGDVSAGAVSIGNTAVMIEPVPETKPGEVPAKVIHVVTENQITTRTVGTQGSVFSERKETTPKNYTYDVNAIEQEAKSQGLNISKSGNQMIITQPVDYTYQWKGTTLGASAGFVERFQNAIEEQNKEQDIQLTKQFGTNWRMFTVSPGVAEKGGFISSGERKEAEAQGSFYVIPPGELKAGAEIVSQHPGINPSATQSSLEIITNIKPGEQQPGYQFPEQAKLMEKMNKGLVQPVTTKEESLLSKVGLGEGSGSESLTGFGKTYGRSLAQLGMNFALPVSLGTAIEQAGQTAITHPKTFFEILKAGAVGWGEKIKGIPDLFKQQPVQTSAKALAYLTPLIASAGYQGYQWLKWRNEQPVTTFTEIASPSDQSSEVTGTAITKFGDKAYRTTYGGESEVKEVAGDISRGTASTKLLTEEIGGNQKLTTLSEGSWISKVAKENPDYNLLAQENMNKFISAGNDRISVGFQGGKYAVRDYGDLQSTIGETLQTGSKGQNAIQGNIGGLTRIAQSSEEKGFDFIPGLQSKLQTSTGTASALDQLQMGIKELNKPEVNFKPVPFTPTLKTSGTQTSTGISALALEKPSPVRAYQAPSFSVSSLSSKGFDQMMKPISLTALSSPISQSALSTPEISSPGTSQELVEQPIQKVVTPDTAYFSRVGTIQPKEMLDTRVIMRQPQLNEQQMRGLTFSSQNLLESTSSLMKSKQPTKEQTKTNPIQRMFLPQSSQGLQKQNAMMNLQLQQMAFGQMQRQRVVNRTYQRVASQSAVPNLVINRTLIGGGTSTGESASGKGSKLPGWYNYFERLNPVASTPKEISKVFGSIM